MVVAYHGEVSSIDSAYSQKLPNLQSFNLAILRRDLLSPTALGLSQRFEACFELVDLPPTRIELFAHIAQLLNISCFGFFSALVKVKLYLTESLQTGDKIIVENTEVGKRFRLCSTVLLLHKSKLADHVEHE